MYYIYALVVVMHLLSMAQKGVLYTYIGVGLSALLVSTYRAMREPRYVERAEAWLHVFLLYVYHNKIINLNAAKLEPLALCFLYYEIYMR